MGKKAKKKQKRKEIRAVIDSADPADDPLRGKKNYCLKEYCIIQLFTILQKQLQAAKTTKQVRQRAVNQTYPVHWHCSKFSTTW